MSTRTCRLRPLMSLPPSKPRLSVATTASALTDCESITPAVGAASRPSVSRTCPCSRSWNSRARPCFRQPSQPQQIRRVGGVPLVVPHPPVGEPLHPQRMGAGARRDGVQGAGRGEPLVPAEGEGAVDQGLVAADGTVGADLEVGSAEFVLDLLSALLDPWPQAVEAGDLGQVGRWTWTRRGHRPAGGAEPRGTGRGRRGSRRYGRRGCRPRGAGCSVRAAPARPGRRRRVHRRQGRRATAAPGPHKAGDQSGLPGNAMTAEGVNSHGGVVYRCGLDPGGPGQGVLG